MNDNGRSLPTGWVETTLGEVFRWGSGGTPLRSRTDFYGGSIPWAIIGDLSDGLVTTTASTITEAGLEESSAKWVSPGSVLLAMYGSIGKLGIAGIRLATNQAIAFTNPDPIEAKYLFYYLMHRRPDLSSQGKGGTQQNISQTVIKAFPFLLCPIAEQKRVVDALEGELTKLDAAVAGLERAQANLKRYRASVLQSAVEGRLVPTEAELAREEGRDYESAEVLLDRILAERRHRWEEAELERLKAKGKPPTNDKWRSKYKEPVAPSIQDLPELPEGWCWASPAQLAAHENYSLGIGPFGSNLKVEHYREEGVPLIFVRDIRAKAFGGEGRKYVSHEKADELEPHTALPGDLLITKMGDPPGDVCLYPLDSPRAVITADCIKWRLIRNGLSPLFFVHSVESGLVKKQMMGITKGVAQKKMSLGRFSGIAIAVPPSAEQARIAGEVERLLSVALATTSAALLAKKRCDRLRQGILGWAFAGLLVDRNPDDESAHVLLERIREERPNTIGQARDASREHRANE